MVKIREIKETTCNLWFNDVVKGRTTAIGKITSYLSLTDIRIQIKEEFKNTVKQAENSPYYITWKNADNEIKIIRIFNNGQLESWPVGFFDEYDNQLNKLIFDQD